MGPGQPAGTQSILLNPYYRYRSLAPVQVERAVALLDLLDCDRDAAGWRGL